MPVRSRGEECVDLEERAQEQLERLQSTLNRAFKNVPFYRNSFNAQGIEPAEVESLSDLERLPFTEHEHLGENYPYGLFAVPLRDVVRIHTARGMPNPTVSGYTKQDLFVWRELVARALTAAGVSSADILQISLDAGLGNWGRDYKDGAEVMEAGVIPLTILPPEKQIMILRDYKTSVLVISPTAATQLVEFMFRANLNPNSLSLKTLVLVGESPDEKTRSQLEEQLHVRTWLHYGLSEVPGPAIAFECEDRCGLHISEDHFLPEVVDPATGESVQSGAVGELVLTTLTTRAFPLIRFRTGDRVRLFDDECRCGRTLKRMEWVPSNSEEAVVVHGVKVHRRQLLLQIERVLGFVPAAYRFFVSREDLRDFLDVRLCVDEAIFSDEVKEMEAMSRRLASELTEEFGVTTRIRFMETRSINMS